MKIVGCSHLFATNVLRKIKLKNKMKKTRFFFSLVCLRKLRAFHCPFSPLDGAGLTGRQKKNQKLTNIDCIKVAWQN
jgi:hypothetical protein